MTSLFPMHFTQWRYQICDTHADEQTDVYSIKQNIYKTARTLKTVHTSVSYDHEVPVEFAGTYFYASSSPTMLESWFGK
jgi:hypothetical protein